MKSTIALLLLLAFYSSSFAQNKEGDRELSFGYGKLTSEELFDGAHIGILSASTQDYSNDFASGILSLHYKYFVSKRLAVGLFAGIEWQTGNFYYNYWQERDYIITTQLGTFSRTAFTIAPNLTFYYTNRKNASFYTSLGMGLMIKKETDMYEPTLYKGSNGLVNYPYALPTTEASIPNNAGKFTAYYSPMGVRFNLGGNIWGNLELGIGYKGIINGGIAYHFNTGKTPKKFTGDVIILPYDEPVSDTWRRLGSVKSGRAKIFDTATTNKEIDTICSKTKMLGGNVFHLKQMIQEGHSRIREITGIAYHVDSLNALAAKLAAHRNAKYKDEPCAYVIVYVPAHPRRAALITFGDRSEVKIKPGRQYVYKLRKEGVAHIATRKSGAIDINAAFGHTYYLKCSFDHRNTRLNQVSELIGEMETSIIKYQYTAKE